MGHSVCLRNSMLSPKETNARQRVLVAARIRIAEHVRDFTRHGAPSFYIATGKIVRLALICCGDCSSWLDNNFSDHRKYMLQVCEAFSRWRAASDHRQPLTIFIKTMRRNRQSCFVWSCPVANISRGERT